jgi:hypothetical protein
MSTHAFCSEQQLAVLTTSKGEARMRMKYVQKYGRVPVYDNIMG